jgi:hypothetical protein
MFRACYVRRIKRSSDFLGLGFGGTRTVGRQIVSRLAVTGAQVCALARTQARLNCHHRSR